MNSISAKPSKPTRRSPESYARAPGRPPDAVLENRVAEAVAILSSRPNIHRCQIHKLLCPRWGVHWRTVDRMVTRARQVLVERLQRPKEAWRCDVMAAYERELASDKPGVRLAALQGIRELLGLDESKRVEVSGPLGGKIELEHTARKEIDFGQLEGLARRLYGLPGKNGDGEPVHPALPDAETSVVPGDNGD